MTDLDQSYNLTFDTTAAIKKISSLNTKLSLTRKRIDSVGNAFEKSWKKKALVSVKAVNAKLRLTKRRLEEIGIIAGVKTTQGLKKVTDEAHRANREVNKLGKTGARSLTKVTRESNKAARGVKRISINTVKARALLGGFARNFRRFVSLPIAAAGLVSAKWARDFNKGMAKISTLIPGQTKRVGELKKEIMGLSKASGVSLGDLTEGVYAAISAWGDGADTMDRMNVVVKASQAGYASTEETLNLLASITETYGDKTLKATEHLADMAFVANKLAIKAPFAEMASSMPKVANIAKELNVTQEELFSSMAAGAGVIGNVTEVSTTMRSMFVALTKETPIMEGVVKNLNKEFGTNYDTVGEAIGDKRVGMMGFLMRLKDGTKNSKEFQKALGGRVEGLNLALALTGSRAGKYNEALEEMTNRTGQMVEAHKEVTDGVDKTGFTFDKMLARLKVMSVRIGEQLLPVLSRFMDRIEPLIKYIEDMDESAIDFYITMGKWLILFGIGSKLLTGLGAFNEVFGVQMMGSMAGAPGKIGATGKALGGLASGVNLLTAALVGYAIGTAISELFVEPAAKASHEAVLAGTDADIEAGNLAKGGTLEEQRAGLKAIDAKRKKLKNRAPQIMGGLIAAVTGDSENSPGAKAGRAYEGLRKGEEILRASIAEGEQKEAGKFLEGTALGNKRSKDLDWGTSRAQAPPTQTTITINAGSADAPEVARMVKRVMEDIGKEADNQMRRAAQDEGAAEQ